MGDPSVIKVFWSWQTDSPASVNRNIIEAAIKVAAKSISKTEPFVLAVDRDTKGVGGTPNISETILKKIAACDVFVWDATVIGEVHGSAADHRPTTNPNVTFELGFAVAALGWERVIGVMNTHFGAPERLPFDLRHRRWPIDYSLASDSTSEERKAVRDGLGKALEAAIRAALKEPRRGLAGADEDLGTVSRLWSVIDSTWMRNWFEYQTTYVQYGEDTYFQPLESYFRLAEQPENAFIDPELRQRHDDFVTAVKRYLGTTAVEMVVHKGAAGRFVLSVKAAERYDDDYHNRYQAQIDRVQATVDEMWAAWGGYVLRVRALFPGILASFD